MTCRLPDRGVAWRKVPYEHIGLFRSFGSAILLYSSKPYVKLVLLPERLVVEMIDGISKEEFRSILRKNIISRMSRELRLKTRERIIRGNG